MFHSKLFQLGTAFTTGFSICYYLSSNNFLSSNSNRLHAAELTIPTSSQFPTIAQSKDTSNLPTTRVNEIMRFGYPSLDNLRIFSDYVLSYDKRNRVANWVFEHINSSTLRSSEDTDRGKSDFKEDEQIHPYFRSKNTDYKGSGYDRGHLAPAANHRSNQAIMDQTFYLSNMAPQVGVGFNRDKWNDLEKYVRGLAKKYNNVWVCTGPLYLPRKEIDNKMYIKYEVIGSQHVAVPTHFFKVVLCENNGNYELQSFVLPNSYCEKDIPLTNYLVPLESIERAAGFLIFDRISKKQLKLINGKAA